MAITAEKGEVDVEGCWGGGAEVVEGAESIRERRLVLLFSMEGAVLEDCVWPAAMSLQRKERGESQLGAHSIREYEQHEALIG